MTERNTESWTHTADKCRLSHPDGNNWNNRKPLENKTQIKEQCVQLSRKDLLMFILVMNKLLEIWIKTSCQDLTSLYFNMCAFFNWLPVVIDSTSQIQLDDNLQVWNTECKCNSVTHSSSSHRWRPHSPTPGYSDWSSTRTTRLCTETDPPCTGLLQHTHTHTEQPTRKSAKLTKSCKKVQLNVF